MLRKNKVEVFDKGKWVPVERTFDPARFGWLLLLVSFFGIGALVYFKREKLFTVKGDFLFEKKESDTNFVPKKERNLIGITTVNDQQSLVDNEANLYRVESGKLVLQNSKLIALAVGETVASVTKSSRGIVIGINNVEQKPLVKFMRMEEAGKFIEEKIIYNASLIDAGRWGSRVSVFVSANNRLITRDDSDLKFQERKLPVESGNVADYGAFDNFIYVLSRRNGLYRAEISGIRNAEAQWQEMRKEDKENLKDESVTRPFILQGFDSRTVIVTDQGKLEEYSVADRGANLSYSADIKEIKIRKPDFLGAFIITDLSKTDYKKGWCLANKIIARCLGIDESVRVFPLDKKEFLVSSGDLFWLID